MENTSGRTELLLALADVEAKLQQAKNTLANIKNIRHALERIYGSEFCAGDMERRERPFREKIVVLESERDKLLVRLRD